MVSNESYNSVLQFQGHATVIGHAIENTPIQVIVSYGNKGLISSEIHDLHTLDKNMNWFGFILVSWGLLNLMWVVKQLHIHILTKISCQIILSIVYFLFIEYSMHLNKL